MGTASYTAHISNKKNAITSKTKLKSVANHNLRKYQSSDYNRDNILLLYGTGNLYKDVQEVYHKEFDEVLKIYNENQKRSDRGIDDYFEHVSKLDQDMAVEIIIQYGDREFWEEHADKKDKMYYVYNYTLSRLKELLPGFKVAKETEKLENLEGDIGRSRMNLAEIKGSIATKNTILEYTQDELGTVETMEANVEAMERDLAEILRLRGEEKRLWKEYEVG